MTTKDARHEFSPVPILSTPAPARQGEGVGETCKTNTAQVSVRPRIRRKGGQPGNRNAVRPVPSLSTIERKNRALNKRVRQILAACGLDQKSARKRRGDRTS